MNVGVATGGTSRKQWTATSLTALIVILCATALVLFGLAVRQFVSYDGFWHVFIARQETWPDFWREVVGNAHPPLYYLALGVAIKALGTSFLAYRAISI